MPNKKVTRLIIACFIVTFVGITRNPLTYNWALVLAAVAVILNSFAKPFAKPLTGQIPGTLLMAYRAIFCVIAVYLLMVVNGTHGKISWATVTISVVLLAGALGGASSSAFGVQIMNSPTPVIFMGSPTIPLWIGLFGFWHKGTLPSRNEIIVMVGVLVCYGFAVKGLIEDHKAKKEKDEKSPPWWAYVAVIFNIILYSLYSYVQSISGHPEVALFDNVVLGGPIAVLVFAAIVGIGKLRKKEPPEELVKPFYWIPPKDTWGPILLLAFVQQATPMFIWSKIMPVLGVNAMSVSITTIGAVAMFLNWAINDEDLPHPLMIGGLVGAFVIVTWHLLTRG